MSVTGQQEGVLFFHEIGIAITEWASVESQLWHVFVCALGRSQYEETHDAFYSVENFRSKLAMVDATVMASTRVAAMKAREKAWPVLLKDCSRLAAARNRLVHRQLAIDGNRPAGRRLMLIENRSGTQKPPKKKQKWPGALCLRDIAKLALEFEDLSDRLREFSGHMAGFATRPLEYQTPTIHPPTIQSLNARMLAVSQRQLKSSPQ